MTACLLSEGHLPLLATRFGQGQGQRPAQGAEHGAVRGLATSSVTAGASGRRLLPVRSKCGRPAMAGTAGGHPVRLCVCDIWAWDRRPRGRCKPWGWPSPWAHSPMGTRVCHVFDSDLGPKDRAVGPGRGGRGSVTRAPHCTERRSPRHPLQAPQLQSKCRRLQGPARNGERSGRSGCTPWTPGPLPAPGSRDEDAFSGNARTGHPASRPGHRVTGRPCHSEGADTALT